MIRWSFGRLFLAGVMLGAAIWLLSPFVTGFQEPWDAPGSYYRLALGAAGLALGFAAPRRFWAAPLAIGAGEFLVFAVRELLPPEPLWVLGVIALVVELWPALVGAVAGGLVGIVVGRVLMRPASRADAP